MDSLPAASEPSPAAPASLPVLSAIERRALGVMVEKAKTTPDVYPMSLNALTTGCNQKNNREPVTNLHEDDVEDALADLQKKGLAMKITGGRVERWRHYLYEAWHVNKVELAILAELLLRGAQTEGELRGRANRMEPIADVDALRNVLGPLAERKMVVYLTEEGRRGTMLTHGFHDPSELESQRGHARTTASAEPSMPSSPRPQPAASSDVLERLTALETRLAQIEGIVRDLKEKAGQG